MGSIFPNLISFDGTNCRTPELNPILTLFTSIGAEFRVLKKGTLTSKSKLSPNAENVGFEPTVPCGTLVFKTSPFDHSGNSPIAPPKVLIL